MQLRVYQDEASDALFKDIQVKECHPVVVIPTGAGKTFIICDFVNKCLSRFPEHNILVLSHVKEILQQDYDALENWFDGYEVGLFSAGLESRTVKKVTVAGIQSVYKRTELFKQFNIVIIDECHLVTINQAGMYRKFLSTLDANYVGFTATHFRLGHGYIHKGKGALFNKISYDLSSPEYFNRLVDEGYLTDLISKETESVNMSVEGIRIQAGDYKTSDLSKKYDITSITLDAVNEIIKFGCNYKKWLIFAIDIAHAEHITKMLQAKNIAAECVHSKTQNRDDIISAFRKGKYRAIVNVNVLTTGFDVPDIDLIATLRPTKSPVMHVQSIGRGLRVAQNKTHCLVLDFAGNTSRLGPINDIKLNKKGEKTGRAITKTCPDCKVICHPKEKFCKVCGHQFKFKINLMSTASTKDIVKKSKAKWYVVNHVKYMRHKKVGMPDSMKVLYRVGGCNTFSEWICLDHKGFAKTKAINWINFRLQLGVSFPNNINELLNTAEFLKKPDSMLINLDSKYPIPKKVLFKTKENGQQSS